MNDFAQGEAGSSGSDRSGLVTREGAKSDAAPGQNADQTLPILVGAESEMGRREENQDSMTGFLSDVGAVYLIADGMGGHRGGAKASRIISEGVRRHLSSASPDRPVTEAVTEAVQLANAEVLQQSRSGDGQYDGMGSTLCVAIISQRADTFELVTAHVGDSRIYLQRNGTLALLTKDHTYVQRLVDSEAIDREAARTHPEASVLTRAMGQTERVEVDVSAQTTLMDGDGILLCSDGLSGFVPHEALEEEVRRHNGPAECARALVELALRSGSDDNITVQFIRFGGTPHLVDIAREDARMRERTTKPEAEVLAMPTLDPPRQNIWRIGWARWAGYVVLAVLVVLLGIGLYVIRRG